MWNLKQKQKKKLVDRTDWWLPEAGVEGGINEWDGSKGTNFQL